MKVENTNSLEKLSLMCHISGLFSVFVGVLVIAIDFYNGNFMHIQVGFYVFLTGYANVKISKKLSDIMYSEQI